MLIEALAFVPWLIAYASSGAVVMLFGMKRDVAARNFVMLYGSTILVGAVYFFLSLTWALTDHNEIIRKVRVVWTIYGGVYSLGTCVVFFAVYRQDFNKLFRLWKG